MLNNRQATKAYFVDFYFCTKELEHTVVEIARKLSCSLTSFPTIKSWLSGASQLTYIDTKVAKHISIAFSQELSKAVKLNLLELNEFVTNLCKLM